MKIFFTLSALLCFLHLSGAPESVKAVLFPFREAVISPRLESTVMQCHFKIGESFSKDAVLLSLDDSKYLLKARQMKNQLQFAEALLADKKELRKGNFASDFELKKAEYEYQSAKIAFDDAMLSLDLCKIRAPFAGKIVEILKKEFETVRSGEALLKIIDDSKLLAVMNIPADRAVKTGDPISILLDDKRTVTGTIHEISPQRDHRTGTIRIRVIIDNLSGSLRAGMTGELAHGK